MSEQPTTCGEGLAAHARLHTRLADVLAAVGKNFEVHLTSLDPSDPVSRPELDAYTSLLRQHRDLAARLRATADEMASYRDLPMANHDMDVLAGAAAADALRDLLAAEEVLIEMLQESTGAYRAMLSDEGAG